MAQSRADGDDVRLRVAGSAGGRRPAPGSWKASDGAAGRMTAQAGLHNLPTELRSAVRAPHGRILVRATSARSNLGCWPRSPAMRPWPSPRRTPTSTPRWPTGFGSTARRPRSRSSLRCTDRPRARPARPCAAWTQLPAGDGLPAGGRRRRPGRPPRHDLRRSAGTGVADPGRAGRQPGPDVAAARGRFTRNAVIQGAAAELFKAWAATVRLAVAARRAHRPLPARRAARRSSVGRRAKRSPPSCSAPWLDGGPWFGSSRVRFVADVRAVERWSDAKD